MMKPIGKSEKNRRVRLALPLLGPFIAVLSITSNAAAQYAQKLQCFGDNMRAIDVRACAAMANTPGISAKDRSAVFATRAAAWMNEEEPAAAAADFSRALEFDPVNLIAIAGRARAYSLLGRHDLAAHDWDTLITINPNMDENYRHRGASLLAAGKPDEALADFTKAITINPRSPDGYVGRARVYEHLNRRDKALNEFELAVGVNSGLWTTYLARAELADRWGDVKMAIDNYKLVVKYNNRYWNAYKALHRLGASHAFDEE